MVRSLPFLLALLLIGCGGSGDSVKDDDSGSVKMFLEGYEDIREPRFIGRHFAAGKAPAKTELAKYAKHGIEIVGTPRVQGSSATVQVKILDAKGKDLGTKEWTLVKDGSAWKFESAPLP
jgi:hypothetical protein